MAIADALAVVKVGNSECEFLKLTPVVADLGHRGRGLGRDDPSAQPVRHEQDDVMRRAVLRHAAPADGQNQASGQHHD